MQEQLEIKPPVKIEDLGDLPRVSIQAQFFGSGKLYKYLYDSVSLKVEVNSDTNIMRFSYIEGDLCIIIPDNLLNSMEYCQIASSIAMMVGHAFLRHRTRIKNFKRSSAYDPELREEYNKILDYWSALFIEKMLGIKIVTTGISMGNHLEYSLGAAATLFKSENSSVFGGKTYTSYTTLSIDFSDPPCDDHDWIWEDEDEASVEGSANGDDGDGSGDGQPSDGDDDDDGQGDEDDGGQGDRPPKMSDLMEDFEASMMPDFFEQKGMKKSDIESAKRSIGVDREAGSQAGQIAMEVLNSMVKRKPKWEKVVRFTVRAEEEDKEFDAWDKDDRRLSIMSKGMMMPGKRYEIKKTKIPIFLFMDTSGSCVNYAERFWKAAASIDPKKFDIRLFCFDTKVYETTLKSRKLYGFGGTSFPPIEAMIQKVMKDEGISYPKAVFVITDGYGNPLAPQKPERWHWFMTEYFTISSVPKGCKIYNLSDYE